MAYIQQFGAYVPDRVVDNRELASRYEVTPEWIVEMSGIEQRRYAAPGQSVVDLAVSAARPCTLDAVGMVIVASGSAERRFPGPAVSVAQQLGITGVPAIDLPMASAGSLCGIALAADLVARYGDVLVVAAEKMSALPMPNPGSAILFGDGAGACVVSKREGPIRLMDSALHSDGAFSEDLRLGFDSSFEMNGRTVIMQASRKIPAVIQEVLDRRSVKASEVAAFLMHQANQNLIDRVAKSLGVESAKFYSNISRYGNTSSASMLIAAHEWWSASKPASGGRICFCAFGAGFTWGAALASIE